MLVFVSQFRSPWIFILLAALAVTVLLGEHLDASVIAAVLALNAVIGFTQERKAEGAVRALMQLVVPHARVVRDGREQEIDSRQLVPGDVVDPEDGEQPRATIEDAAERLEDDLVETGRVARRVDVVAEERRGVVRVGFGEIGDGARRRRQAAPVLADVADVAEDGQPVLRLTAGRERLEGPRRGGTALERVTNRIAWSP